MALELDELWSFVAKKMNQSWIWIALCRRTRQVVAYAIGDRSEATCRRLWNAIPAAYRSGHCFTDFWAAYQAEIPEEQHTPVGKKADKRWVWIALARHSRQVVAYAIGDRSERTCRRLWERIPESYKRGCCYSDFWEAYQAVIPEDEHEAVGKDSGELAHVERWNNTLRQRLARFVRKTLSFSKSVVLHEACLLLFLHRYNQDRAIILM